MANYCSNNIYTENQKVIDVFKRLQEKEKKESKGQTLKYFKDDRYLFDISVEGENIFCETKWAPPLDTIKALANKFNTDITMEYDEPGGEIYGVYSFINGVENDTFLESHEWNSFEYDEDKDMYIFEGEQWKTDYDIKDLLLDRKRL